MHVLCLCDTKKGNCKILESHIFFFLCQWEVILFLIYQNSGAHCVWDTLPLNLAFTAQWTILEYGYGNPTPVFHAWHGELYSNLSCKARQSILSIPALTCKHSVNCRQKVLWLEQSSMLLCPLVTHSSFHCLSMHVIKPEKTTLD